MRYRRELECVARMDRRARERSCGEFEDGAGSETTRQTPGGDAASDLSDNVPAVDEDEIDGEAHSEGMYRLAGHDP